MVFSTIGGAERNPSRVISTPRKTAGTPVSTHGLIGYLCGIPMGYAAHAHLACLSYLKNIVL